jgi:hypothetical protein
MRPSSCIFLLLSFPALTLAQQDAPGLDGIEIPPGPPMPVIREVQCQSEVCLPGIYLACTELEVTDVPGPGHRVVASLSRGDRFRVVAARTVVLSAAVVRVTRDVDAVFGRPVNFREGEFLFLLDDRGEGFYNAWRDGEVIRVEQFWPSGNFGPPAGFEYGAELIRQGESERWYGIQLERLDVAWEIEGLDVVWVHSRAGSMLDPFVISTSGLAGRQDPIEACPQ